MPDLDPVFERLAAMLREHAEGLVATRDDADQLYLETSQDPAEFFGAVMRKKAQVAYHLMPVYRDPGLLADLGGASQRELLGALSPPSQQQVLDQQRAGHAEHGRQRQVALRHDRLQRQ